MAYAPALASLVLRAPSDWSAYAFDGSSWRAFPVSSQAPTADIALATGGNGRLYAFGGHDVVTSEQVDQLLILDDDDDWRTVEVARAPRPRFSAEVAYDEARGRVVMFGGFDSTYALSGETWEWDGATWLRALPVVSPPARQDHMMAFDPVRRRVVMVGGYGATLLDDAWAYDGTTWTPIAPAVRPPARTWGVLVGNRAAGHVLLAGGYGDAVLADTWTLVDDSWTALPPMPAARNGAMAAYDERRERVVLFGGTDGNKSATTWEHDGEVWHDLDIDAASAPPGRYIGGMAYDPLRGRIVLFGGGSFFRNDYWEFDGQQWAERLTATVPTPRELHAMTFDPVGRQVLMFGGLAQEGGTSFSGETWTLAFANANAPRESCGDAVLDVDDDGLAGCADPDCWARCTPGCAPAAPCDGDGPRCGDGVCAPSLEDAWQCPADCS
jgi:hypothetical protein